MTLPSLTIEGFRAFRRLEVPRLARVNLVVGSNNVGKTSLLEALRLFAAGSTFPTVLDDILANRRELATDRGSSTELSWHLRSNLLRVFHDSTEAGSYRKCRITGGEREVSMNAAWAIPDDNGEHSLDNRPGRFKLVQDEPVATEGNALQVLEVRIAEKPPIPVLLDGSLPSPRPWLQRPSIKASFIPSSGLNEDDSADLWDFLVLHDEETFLVEVLRVIAPDVERVFFIKGQQAKRTAFVRRTGHRAAEPLYSLGGGMRRLLELALGLVEARSGVLLVDEIENGIHYAVQPDLWSLVFEAATRLDVQVFATTHSWDCIEAFQQAAAAHPATGELIRLHRTETGIEATVADEADLAIITRQAIEVR